MATRQSKTKQKKVKYGSDVIVDLMKAFDVEYAAFNPGATFRGIHDSILNYGGNKCPEVIFCCHEEYSVAIAHGYAKAKGKPMVAITHDLVGLQHASMAIFNAWCDRVPLIVLGGTGPMDTSRRRPQIDWIHTALVQGNQVRDYVKWDDQPYSLKSVPESFIRGYRISTTEPKAPVYICYDADLQEDPVTDPVEIPDVSRFAPPAPMQADPEALRRAAELLVGARSPLIIADFFGRNHKALPSLVKLAELLAIPVIDKGGRFNFPNNHPLDATGDAGEVLAQADVILALDVQDLYGSLVKTNRTKRLKAYVTKPSAQIIHITLNDMLVRSWAQDYHCLQAVDVSISADTALAVPELISMCRRLLRKNEGKKKTVTSRLKKRKIQHEKLRKSRSANVQRESDTGAIPTSFLAQELWEVIKNEDWVMADCSSFFFKCIRRLWDLTKPYHSFGRSSGAGLGYGLSAAIGAALAFRESDKICIDIQSDGDLLMTSGALYTAAHHKIPLLIIMHNNQSFYNSEEHNIRIAEFRNRPVELAGIGTRVDNPPVDFKKVAEGFGLYGDGPIRRPEDLRPALQKAFAVVKEKKLPALVDVISASR